MAEMDQDAGLDEALAAWLRRWLRAAHLLALPLCLGLGLWLCGTDLGWSDSLWLTQPGPSLLAYVTTWYTGLNGRLAQAIVAGLARLPFSFSASPESFPFWVFSGLSFYCALMTPVLVGTSVAQAVRSRPRGAVVALLLLAVWSTNPVLFENVTYHHFAIFIDYLLPTFLAALWFRHAHELARGRLSRRGLALHALGYLFLSNYVEVFLLSIPLIGLLAWACGHRTRPRPARHWAWLAFAYSALSAAAAFIYWLSPGQRKRAVLAGMTVPSLSDLPLSTLRDLVPVQFFGLRPEQGAVIYVAACLSLAGLLIAWAVRSRARWPGERPSAQNGVAAAAALLFLAHGTALLPALVVQVVGRVAIYPGLLLVTSLALVVVAVLPAPASGRAASLLLACATVAALGVAGAQLHRCAAVQKERRELFALRRSIYSYVLGLQGYAGNSAFVLTDCNVAPGGEPIEPPWGLQAYFAWGGRARPLVFVDSNDDYPRRPSDRRYVRLSCRSFSRPHTRRPQVNE